VGLGRISYGIYLWHVPLAMLLAPYPHAKIAVVPLASIFLAWVSYRFIEKRFLSISTSAKNLHIVGHSATADVGVPG
jgi:peptidoglycan/LPS O-acetylase OafA/YrhL